MKIVIAGGSGFLGEALKEFFHQKGDTVLVLARNPKKENELFWDGKTLGAWQNSLENSDILINLAGKSVDCRYNDKNRAEILNSRIDSTNVLQQALDLCGNPPRLWLNASSATTYIHSEQQPMTEKEGIIGDDFSMNICKAWEAAFYKTENDKIRKVALRTSIVMGKNGGAFPKFKQIAQLGLGGKQGNGNQMMSWIHIDDFCEAVDFIIQLDNLSGSINVTAPEPLPNHSFMQKLRNQLKVSIGIPSPKWLLELACVPMQTETELMLKSRFVIPERLLDAGFKFQYPSFDFALPALLE